MKKETVLIFDIEKFIVYLKSSINGSLIANIEESVTSYNFKSDFLCYVNSDYIALSLVSPNTIRLSIFCL